MSQSGFSGLSHDSCGQCQENQDTSKSPGSPALLCYSLSHARLFVTPWSAARQASLPFTISRSLLKLHCVSDVSNRLIFCSPLLLLPSVFPSIRVFSDESALRIRWPKNWSFSVRPSNEYSGLVSFRTDWLDLSKVKERTNWSLTPHQSRAPWFHLLTQNLCCWKPAPWGSPFYSQRFCWKRSRGGEGTSMLGGWAPPSGRMYPEGPWGERAARCSDPASPLETPLGPPPDSCPLGVPLWRPALWRLTLWGPPSGDPPLGPCWPFSEQVVRQPRTPFAESPPVTLCWRENRQRR